jgi:hypothetical protein
VFLSTTSIYFLVKNPPPSHDANVIELTRGGRRRPEKGVLLKCELSMGAPAGNNQAQYPEVLIALELECCQLGRTRLILRDMNPIFTIILSYLTTH